MASFVDYDSNQEDPSPEEIIDELEVSKSQEKVPYDINEELNSEKRKKSQLGGNQKIR